MSVYDEARECVILGKTKYDETKKQMDKYKNEGFPKNFGLGENNIIFRKHNSDNIIKLMNDWWEELNTQTKRDQLSLAYVLWKNGEKFSYMDESAREGRGFFEYIHHNSFRNRSLKQRIKDSIKIRTRTQIAKILTTVRVFKI